MKQKPLVDTRADDITDNNAVGMTILPMVELEYSTAHLSFS